MNAKSAARCDDDDDDDDEDGEAADMEGIIYPNCNWAVTWTCTWTHVVLNAVFSEYEESGLLETDEVDGSKCGRFLVLSNISYTYTFFPPVSRRPLTPVKWWKLKPKQSLGARMPSSRLEHMTCTSHMINTTRPLDSGCLDTTKYAPSQNGTV